MHCRDLWLLRSTLPLEVDQGGLNGQGSMQKVRKERILEFAYKGPGAHQQACKLALPSSVCTAKVLHVIVMSYHKPPSPPNPKTFLSQFSMSDSTDLTVAQAREIVLRIAQSKGWVGQRLREKSDPETLELLRIIEKIREELGDAVETCDLLNPYFQIAILTYSPPLGSLGISILERRASYWN